MRLDEFLLARIAEDEAVASEARSWSDRDWTFHVSKSGDRAYVSADATDPILDAYSDYLESATAVLHHAARHDPARVLAECAAKRAIVAEHPVNPETIGGDGYGEACSTCNTADDPRAGAAWPCATLRHLAAIYADHPDYTTWRGQ